MNVPLPGYSKLANILHSKELQRRFKAETIPITCISLHPGIITTGGTDGFFDSVPYVGWILKGYVAPLFFSPPRSGALGVGFAAAGKDVQAQREKYEGAYLVPVATIATPSKYALDERLAKELYDTTRQILEEIGL